MKRNINDYQGDLKKGWDQLIHASEDIRKGFMMESGKLGYRFQKNRLDKKIERNFREIGKQVLNLDQENESLFATQPELKKRLQETRELLKERENLTSEMESSDQE